MFNKSYMNKGAGINLVLEKRASYMYASRLVILLYILFVYYILIYILYFYYCLLLYLLLWFLVSLSFDE